MVQFMPPKTPVVRYVLKSESEETKHTSGVFAFPLPLTTSNYTLKDIDDQASAYFEKHKKSSETFDRRIRWYGTMQGWFFKIPVYKVPEGFGNMVYEYPGRICDF